MSDERIIKLVEDVGVNNIKHNDLMNAYQHITGAPMRTNCSGCVKRKAIRLILKHYNEIKAVENDKERT